MILDTSALLAILLREPEAECFARAIESARHVRLSVAGYLEAAIYIDRNLDEIRRAMVRRFDRTRFFLGLAGGIGSDRRAAFRIEEVRSSPKVRSVR